MKASGSLGALAGVMALSCVLGLGPQEEARAAVVLTGCGGGDFGADCSLAELVSGGSMEIANTRFSNVSLSTFAGRALNASLIRVDPLDVMGNPGFRLVDTAPGTLSVSNAEQTNSDFSFDVTALTGVVEFRTLSLAMAVGSLSGPNSFVHTFANVFDSAQTTQLGATDAFCGTPSCANTTVSDAAVFPPAVTSASVFGGIDAVADTTGVAQINSITMQFNQVTAVPEPGSLALMSLGLAGLGFVRRRRRHARAAA